MEILLVIVPFVIWLKWRLLAPLLVLMVIGGGMHTAGVEDTLTSRVPAVLAAVVAVAMFGFLIAGASLRSSGPRATAITSLVIGLALALGLASMSLPFAAADNNKYSWLALFLANAGLYLVTRTAWKVAAEPTYLATAEKAEHTRSEVRVESATAENTSNLNNVPVSKPRFSLADVGGMIEFKREIEPFLAKFRNYGRAKSVSDRNGLLLSGPPGTGKTFMAEAVAGELGLPFLSVSTDMVISEWMGRATGNIAAIVQQAIACAPCVLFIDEIDAIAPRRDSANVHDETIKVVNTMLQAVGTLRDHKVVLIAATNHYDRIDTALIRDGRFDFRLEVPYPDLAARKSIIDSLAKKHSLAINDADRDSVAAYWVERSTAFMAGAFKRARDDANGAKQIHADALKKAGRNASRREGSIPKDCLGVHDLFLPKAARDEVESLMYRMANWDTVAALGGSAPKGVMLYGPPGTGKTTLARAIAKSMGGWHVFVVKTAEVLADPRKFNDVIRLAREHRPAIVFLDEADELLRDRSFSASATATNEVLTAMDGMMEAVPEVVFFAATNKPEAMDAAAMRGGRFGDRIFLDAFRGHDLEEYIAQLIRSRPGMMLSSEVNPRAVARIIEEAGPADINEVLSKSVNYTLANGGQRPITLADVERARVSLMG